MRLNIRIEKQGSPKGYDVAFASIDQSGNPGNLNQFVLKELGIDLKYLPQGNKLKLGLYQIETHEGECIVNFIVTVGFRKSRDLLKSNFSKALKSYSKQWNNKRVWIPLMGVGVGGLDILTSFSIIIEGINTFDYKDIIPKEIVISLPQEADDETFKKISKLAESVGFFAENREELEDYEPNEEEEEPEDNQNQKRNNLINSGKRFFALGHFWGDDDHMERFLKERIWENGHDKKLIGVVNRVKVGDIVFLKSTFKKDGQGTLRIKAIGVVTNNPGDGHKLDVNWEQIKGINLPGLGGTMSAINQIGERNVIRVIEGLSEQLPEMFEIIEKLEKQVDQSSIEKKPEKDTPSKQFWWINANKIKWVIDDQSIGNEIPYGTHQENGNKTKIFEHFFTAKKGDLCIGHQTGESTKAIFEVVKEAKNREGDEISFKVIYKFKDDEQFSFRELKKHELFKDSEVVKANNQASILKLSYGEYHFLISKKVENEIFEKEFGQDKLLIIQPTKTGLDNDGAYTANDLLDIENDVRSFALILASKDIKPPLAVSLFGAWGSGKSFFMEHLSKRVDELSINQGFLEEGETYLEQSKIIEEDSFCKGIAQIKFNAWSYLDANLWAGLVSSIFEKLDEYISTRSKGDNEKIELRKHLSEKLEILASEKKEVKHEITNLNKEKETLKSDLIELDDEKDKLISNIADKKLSEIIEVAISKSNLEGSVRNDLSKYGITENRIKELSPSELYTEAKSWTVFLKNLIQFSPIYICFFLLAALALFFVWVDPYQIASNFFNLIGREITAVIAIIGPWFAKGYNTFSKYKKIIEPITDFKNKFNKDLEEAKFQYEQNKELLEINIENKRTKINQAESKIVEIDEQLDVLDYTLKNFIAKKAFNNFIKRRINEKGYEEHLGLVSIIRKDFETLSNLFQETEIDTNAPKEIQKEQEKRLEEHKKIVDLFKEDKVLDRIILYIDDLDRCSDEKVLEVIQAVHLLMAFPLFNVVVGVDKRCVNNALIYKNLLQYSKFTTLDKIEEVGIHVISPSEYLEKIFQIPFQLNDPDEKLIKGMVNAFLSGQIEEELPEQPDNLSEQLDFTKIPKEELSGEEENKDARGEPLPKTDKKEIEKKRVITHEDLKLSEEEVELLKEIAWLVGSIPRTIKRFINIYRIIRSHQNLDYDSNNKRKEFLSIMFILAINIGKHKIHADKLMKCIESNMDKRLIDLFDLDDLKNHDDLKEIRIKIASIEAIKELLQFKGSQFSKHIPFVGRFSFGNVENGNNNSN